MVVRGLAKTSSTRRTGQPMSSWCGALAVSPRYSVATKAKPPLASQVASSRSGFRATRRRRPRFRGSSVEVVKRALDELGLPWGRRRWSRISVTPT